MFIFWLLHLDTAKCDFILFFIEILRCAQNILFLAFLKRA